MLGSSTLEVLTVCSFCRGNWSDVVLAVHNITKQKVALKIIDKQRLDTEKKRRRLKTEVKLHKRVQHPYVVKFIEPYESEIDVCLVMELCEGGDLFYRIKEKGRFSEKEAFPIIEQITVAVQYLHSIGKLLFTIKVFNFIF
jgi:serine/threonine protein kinase